MGAAESPDDKLMDNATKAIFTVLTALVIALGGWVWNTSHALNRLTWQLEREQKQDATIRKHWRLHRWTKDELTRLGREHDFELKSWPDLGED